MYTCSAAIAIKTISKMCPVDYFHSMTTLNTTCKLKSATRLVFLSPLTCHPVLVAAASPAAVKADISSSATGQRPRHRPPVHPTRSPPPPPPTSTFLVPICGTFVQRKTGDSKNKSNLAHLIAFEKHFFDEIKIPAMPCHSQTLVFLYYIQSPCLGSEYVRPNVQGRS